MISPESPSRLAKEVRRFATVGDVMCLPLNKRPRVVQSFRGYFLDTTKEDAVVEPGDLWAVENGIVRKEENTFALWKLLLPGGASEKITLPFTVTADFMEEDPMRISEALRSRTHGTAEMCGHERNPTVQPLSGDPVEDHGEMWQYQTTLPQDTIKTGCVGQHSYHSTSDTLGREKISSQLQKRQCPVGCVNVVTQSSEKSSFFTLPQNTGGDLQTNEKLTIVIDHLEQANHLERPSNDKVEMTSYKLLREEESRESMDQKTNECVFSELRACRDDRRTDVKTKQENTRKMCQDMQTERRALRKEMQQLHENLLKLIGRELISVTA